MNLSIVEKNGLIIAHFFKYLEKKTKANFSFNIFHGYYADAIFLPFPLENHR